MASANKTTPHPEQPTNDNMKLYKIFKSAFECENTAATNNTSVTIEGEVDMATGQELTDHFDKMSKKIAPTTCNDDFLTATRANATSSIRSLIHMHRHLIIP